MSRRSKLILIAPFAMVGIAVLVTLCGWLVMLLWNWLTPVLFGWPQITMWQGLGLLVLCRVLFAGLGGHSGHGVRRRIARRTMDDMMDGMLDRWERMTPEERERFRRGLRRFGIEPAGERPPDSPEGSTPAAGV